MTPHLACSRCQTLNAVDARFCARCGASLVARATKWSKDQLVGLSIALGVLIFMAIFVSVFERADSTNISQSQNKRTLTPAERAEAQAIKDKACNTVSRLKAAGGFTKIEAGYSGVTHAYVDRGFFAIPVDAKESTMKAVALCYLDIDKKDQMGIVVIHNGYSGKEIGSYDFASGLRLD